MQERLVSATVLGVSDIFISPRCVPHDQQYILVQSSLSETVPTSQPQRAQPCLTPVRWMGLRVHSIVGCLPELCFQFSVVGLRQKFINNLFFPLASVLLVLIINIIIIMYSLSGPAGLLQWCWGHHHCIYTVQWHGLANVRCTVSRWLQECSLGRAISAHVVVFTTFISFVSPDFYLLTYLINQNKPRAVKSMMLKFVFLYGRT